ncbi:hypothetical protein GNP44_18610 [Aliivibrio fischeri]|uniref:DUF6680 family protein n=1 Tax=Aliivibrio fischeri TaxID=668 RepID=UPI0012D9E7CA|nr:DUF6680 family protein [Aliivibrio fischeri]MUK32083.1 hypothetical protein [Aliivibrio fischeri]
MELNMEIKDWITVAAVIIGPIFAVQAQKIIENITERKKRKVKLFHTLMETRATRLSGSHVSALNMIDLEFYGKSIIGKRWQSKAEKEVTNAWKVYNDHLNNRYSEERLDAWGERSTDLFTSLLYAMAQSLGYDFDEVQLKRDCYSPIAHGRIEDEQNQVRAGLLAVLEGRSSLQMHITHLPPYHPIDPAPQSDTLSEK